MKRGDLVTIADKSGDYTGKPRPALIVQADAFQDRPSFTVLPLTSTLIEPSFLLRHHNRTDTRKRP